MNYEESLKYIHSNFWQGSRLGLHRTYELLGKLGNPQNELKFVHIAGTNGKGSTASMIASVLKESGYNVGLYTSPYIHRFNERMQVNGIEIGDDELAEMTTFIRPFAESMEEKPTEFELITALAMEFFRRRKCDIVVLEVGLGGALDSTNVIDTPELAVIVSIGLDHTGELGNTITEIAANKAGIIKEGGDVVIYGQNPEADLVFRTVAAEKHCQLYQPNYGALKMVSHDLTGLVFDYEEEQALKVPLVGTYQLYNAALAVTALKILAKKGWKITSKSLRDGLASTTWRGRFELVSKNPVVLVDGSHNPPGIKATAASLKACFPAGGIVFLIGALADKDVAQMMNQLIPMASEFITVEPPSPRAMKAETLAELMCSLTPLPVTAATSIEEGCRMALEKAGADGVVCALGSLYMVGDITREMESLTKNLEEALGIGI